MMTSNSKKSFYQKNEKILKNLLAGGIAGCCAKSTVAPFDRVKILLQAHNKHYKHLGVFSTVSKVVKKEGPLGLYKGNGAQMVRIFPYAAIQFTSYEFYKQKLKELLGSSHYLAAGSLAGLTAVLFTYPLDVIRARLAFQVAGDELYQGIMHAFYTMFKTEGGIKAFYKGIVPTMLGMTPYAGLSFYSFERLKQMCVDYFPHLMCKPVEGKPDDLILIIPAKLLCGGFAGAVAQTASVTEASIDKDDTYLANLMQTIVYPLDVARRKMQVAFMLQPKDSLKFSTATWYKTLILVFREHGVRKGLYRGLSVNYIKVTPMVAVSFSTYELMRQYLNLDTSKHHR